MAKKANSCITLEEMEDFAAERLGRRDSRRLKEHLAACDACRRKWEAFQEGEKFLGKIREANEQIEDDPVAWEHISKTMTDVEKSLH